MYPYGNPNQNQHQNVGSSNANAFHGMGYYGQMPNQQMQQQQYYPNQQQQFNYAGQMGFPAQFQNAANLPKQNLPHPQQQNMAEDKQKRYKLEQQRKFKNFGKSFANTSIDSMLSNIVSSSEKSKTVTENHVTKQEQDDFGDFLEANPIHTGTASVAPPIVSVASSSLLQPQSQPAYAVPDHSSSTNQPHHSTTPDPLKPDIDLQAKMLSSLDLNQSQHAYMKFKPMSVHHSKRPETKAYQPSTKAANWSSLTSVENAFVVETPVEPPSAASPPEARFPTEHTNAEGSWTFDLANAPLLYRHVYEASLAADGLMDTTRLYPILLQCNLPKQTLGELWAVANQAVPGRLKQNELFALLALIALAQNGQKNLTMESALNLPAAPIPYMAAYQSTEPPKPSRPVDPSPQPSTTTNHSNDSKPEDNFDDFQEFQCVSLPEAKVGHFNEIPPLITPSSSFNDSKSAQVQLPSLQNSTFSSNPNKAISTELVDANHNVLDSRLDPKHMQQANTTTLNTDSWSDFKSVENTEICSVLQPSSAASQHDKYAAFSTLTQETDLFHGLESATTPSPPPSLSNQTDIHPSLKPPAYSSLFQGSNSSELNGLSKSLTSSSKEDDPQPSDFGNFSDFMSSASQDNSLSNPELKPSILEDYSSEKKNSLSSDLGNTFSTFSTLNNGSNPLPSNFNAFSSMPKENNLSNSAFKSSSDDVLNWATPQNTDTSEKKWEGINFTASQRDTSRSPLTIKNSLFKDVLSSSMPGNDTSSIKSDTNSVKSLELHSLSQTISQQSLGTINANAAVQSPTSPQAIQPPAPRKRYRPSFCDDDYDDFAEPPPDLPPDSFGDFDAYEEGNSTLNDFDAFATFEMPKKAQNKTTSPAVADTSRGNASLSDDDMLPVSPASLPVSPVISRSAMMVEDKSTTFHEELKSDTAPYEDAEKEDTVAGEQADPGLENDVEEQKRVEKLNGIVVSDSIAPITRTTTNKYENIEFSSDDWQISPTHSDQTDLYAEKWEKCLTASNEIISKTNETLSSIQSPDLCNEVVYSVKGQRFISDLSEIYAVARRLCYSIRKLKIEKESLQQLHKGIELAWYNLLAFCPNTTVVEPVMDTTNDDGTCGVCLTGLNTISISYAGTGYHATCANFWVNCVDSVLPALQLPAEQPTR